MSTVLWLLAGLFLPLFPLSMVFNAVLARVDNPWLRGLLFVAWPQLGLGLIAAADAPVPGWLPAWATLTAALYALRALAMRDVGTWSGYIATSAWALLWIAAATRPATAIPLVHALGFSLPLLLLALLGGGLERRFGAAYTGVYGGLAQSLPRLSTVLVLVVLALVATPLFPAFGAMLAMALAVMPGSPAVAAGLLVVWLLWSWAGARLLQGLIVGPADTLSAPDLGLASTWAYGAVLGALVIGGVMLIGWQL